jgi:hypothetical protein
VGLGRVYAVGTAIVQSSVVELAGLAATVEQGIESVSLNTQSVRET